MTHRSKYRSTQPSNRQRQVVDRAMMSFRSWQRLTVIDETTPKTRVIARIPTLYFGMVIFFIAGVLTIYIGHIHRTQDLLGEISIQRRENVRLHLQHNRLVADFNASIGPSVIYERGADLGLQRGHEFAGTIQVTPEPAP